MSKGIWTPLTEHQKETMRKDYLKKPVKKLASELGITYGRVDRFLKREGLVIPKRIIEQRKLDSRFKKGHESFNKGLKQADYMSPESIKKTKATRFKKGNIPHNTNYDGHERINVDGYIEQRIRRGVYRLKHRIVWEKKNGPIPKGCLVVFKNGNPLDCSIKNLELITKEENMLRNSKHDYPREIIPSMALVSRIKNKVKTLQDEK